MTVQVGDKAPAGQFHVINADGPGSLSTDELFNGKKVVVFSVPGAFTPTCSKEHLPGFIDTGGRHQGQGGGYHCLHGG